MTGIPTDESTLPTFLCVGAQRSGTTWLFENLRYQPGVSIPDMKEVGFFTDLRPDLPKLSLEGYAGLFASSPVRGEITPEYLVDPGAPDRIADTLGPHTRIVVLLRDPAERAYSAFSRAVRDGDWRGDFDAYLGGDQDLCVTRGRYAEQVARYVERFDFVDVRFHDEIVQAPARTLSEVAVGVGIPSPDTSLSAAHFNIGLAARSGVGAGLVLLRDLGYRIPGVRRLAESAQRWRPVNRAIRYALDSGGRGPSIEQRRYVWDRVSHDLARLPEVIGRPYPARWSRPHR